MVYELEVSNRLFKKRNGSVRVLCDTRIVQLRCPCSSQLVISNVTVSYHSRGRLSTLFSKKVIYDKPYLLRAQFFGSCTAGSGCGIMRLNPSQARTCPLFPFWHFVPPSLPEGSFSRVSKRLSLSGEPALRSND